MASTSIPFVPAWKRLGLKLKGSPSSPSTDSPVSSNDVPTKRKSDAMTGHDQNPTPSSKRTKSVSFTAEPTNLSKPASAQQIPTQTYSIIPPLESQPAAPSPKPAAKQRKPRKKEVQAKIEETERYIGYLQQFHSAREEWHFNKGRQTALLKNIFNVFRVPEQHDDALVAYLTGLQGQAARDRLTETANEILKSTKDAVDSDDRMSESTHKEARGAALKKHLKDAKGRIRDETAEEDSASDDRLLLLRKRARADVVLKGLGAGQLATPPENEEPPAKKKRTRRPKKARTGVPDDDLSDDTSSVSSVPSSAGSDDESSSEEESDASSSEDSSSEDESCDDDGNESD